MSRRRLLVTVPLLFLAAPSGGPTFAPADGAAWERVLEERTTWLLDDCLLEVDGVALGFDLPEVEATLERRAVVASAVAVDDRGVRREERVFETLEGAVAMGFELPSEGLSRRYEYELASPLEGETVVFAREEDGTLVPSWPGEGERDETLLRPLSAAADLQALLPAGAAEEGDAWEVDPANAWSLFAPGGALHLRPDGEVPGDEIVPTGAIAVTGFLSFGGLRGTGEEPPVLDGTLRVTWAGTEERDGVSLARLEVSIEGEFELDRRAGFDAVLEDQGLPAGERALDLVLDLEGEGMLLWDLDANLPRALALESEFSAEGVATWVEASPAGENVFFRLELAASGTAQSSYQR